MKRIKFVIPMVIVVALLSAWRIEKDFSTLPTLQKALLIAGASALTGVISYFLFKGETEAVDRKLK